MRRMALLFALLSVAMSSVADDKVLPLVVGSRYAVTPEQLGCVAYDQTIPSTYSLETAKSNARKLEDAGNNMATTGKILVFPAAKWYCVADDNNDGVDIHWHDITGLKAISAGGIWINRAFYTDLTGFFPSAVEGGLIHAGDVGPSGDTVLKLSDFQGAVLELNIRGSLAGSQSAAFNNFSTTDWWDANPTQEINPELHAMTPCALALVNDNSTASSGKSHISLAATLCYRAIDISNVTDAGPDTIEIPLLSMGWCHYGMRVAGGQAVDFNIGRIKNIGTPMQRCLEFHIGGTCKVDEFYLCPGTNLYVNSEINTSRYDLHVRGDGQPVSNPNFRLMDIVTTIIPASVRVTGSFTNLPSHQSVRVARSKPGLHDVQIDVDRFGDEEGAFPLRATRSQWVERRYDPPLLSSTVFGFQADRDRPNGTYTDTDWNVDASTQVVSAAADISSSANVLNDTGGTNPKIVRGEMNCRDAAEFTSDRLAASSPAGNIGSAYDDMSIACVVKPTSPSGSANRIAGCTDPDGTDGWYIGTDASNHVVCRFGGDSAMTTSAVLEQDRPNTIVATRTRSAGVWTVCVNGDVIETDIGNSTATIAAVSAGGKPHLGMAQTGTSTWDNTNTFEGYISSVLVDEDDFADVLFDGSTITATTDATGKVLAIGGSTGRTVVNGDIGKWVWITGGSGFQPGTYRIEGINTSGGHNDWVLSDDASTTSSATGMTGSLKDANHNTRLSYLRQFGAW